MHRNQLIARLVISQYLMYQLSDMKNTEQPDAILVAACRWLLEGGLPGAYAGPCPGKAHDLQPLLAGEMDRKDISLSAAAAWFRLEQIVRPALERISIGFAMTERIRL